MLCDHKDVASTNVVYFVLMYCCLITEGPLTDRKGHEPKLVRATSAKYQEQIKAVKDNKF